jgi:hypothetical protein
MAEGLIIRKDDRNIGIVTALGVIGLLFLLFFLFTYSIPDPPLKEIPVMAETELQEIDLKKYVVQVGKGGGGSGSPTEAPVADKVIPQTEHVITSNKGATTVKTGQSNHTNTTKPNENTASTTQSTPNYFGSGGSGGGNTGGVGQGLGSDNGIGDGDGNGPNGGGTVRRFLVAKPNTTNISSDENCKVILRVLVDEDGTIVGKPQFVKGASTTNNMMLINQVVYVVQSEAKFNKAKGTKLMTQVITIDIVAN